MRFFPRMFLERIVSNSFGDVGVQLGYEAKKGYFRANLNYLLLLINKLVVNKPGYSILGRAFFLVVNTAANILTTLSL